MIDLEDMTKEELYVLAQEQSVKGRSSMDKDELIAALSPTSNPSLDAPLSESENKDDRIDKRPKEELVAWAETLGVEVDSDEENPDVNAILNEMSEGEIADLIIDALPDVDLKKLPEVADNKKVRDHRLDWESAARGETIEVDREIAARAAAERENAAAARSES